MYDGVLMEPSDQVIGTTIRYKATINIESIVSIVKRRYAISLASIKDAVVFVAPFFKFSYKLLVMNSMET
jgi:hypothetical protein